MKKISADYIFPVSSPPIKNGIVVIDDDGKILNVLTPLSSGEGLGVRHFKGIICPGFINSHCHLELSHVKNKIPQKTGLPGFIRHIEQLKNHAFSEEEKKQAILDAENEMLDSGIVAVGDVSNTNISFEQKAKEKLKYHTFIEALGFHPDKADTAFQYFFNLYQIITTNYQLPASITPHAPYSISEKLFKKICAYAEEETLILSMHNQECEDENTMFQNGNGKILETIQSLGIDTSLWKATAKNSLQSVLPFFSRSNKLQLVHNTFSSQQDIASAKAFFNATPQTPNAKLFWCFCPNANLYIENRLPDFQLFMDNDCKITIGTDSLASNEQLSVLEELKTISKNARQLPLNELLKWATLNGAEYLGLEKEVGSIEAGKKPGLVLIENINLSKLQLTESSLARKL